MNEETKLETTTDQPQRLATTPCSPLVVDLLQRIIGVADALAIMEGRPGQTKGERAIWFSCSQQIKEAVAEAVPDWDDVLKAAHEANSITRPVAPALLQDSLPDHPAALNS